MPDQLRPHTYYDRNRLWENFHQTVRFVPERYYDVWNLWEDSSSSEAQQWRVGLSALQHIILDAEQSKRQVRAVGGGWSLSNAVETPGFLLNTRPLNVIEIGLQPKNCDPRFVDNPKHLVFAQCGANIAELSRELENNGLSLSTSGASNGQTICGAMSTGTHGSAFTLEKGGSVQDYILGIHLLSSEGKSYWIEPESRPVVSQNFCDTLGATLKRDDQLFNAVRVSFGCFGIIHAVVLQAEPIFLLERHVYPYHYQKVLPVLSDLDKIPLLKLTDMNREVRDDAFHFEVVLNPYGFDLVDGRMKEKAGEMAAYVRYMYKHPPDINAYPPCGRLKGRKNDDTTISNDVMGILSGLADPFGEFVPGLAKSLIDSQLQPDNGADNNGTLLTHGGTFDATKIPGHSLSTEMGFALEHVPRAVEIIVRQTHKYLFPGLPALRYVRPSTAHLAFARYSPYTCTIEIPAIASRRSQEGIESIWEALKQEQIPYTFHWGQCLRWGDSPLESLQRLQHVFGDRLQQWLQARRDFFSSTQGNCWTFSNPMVQQCGLAEDCPRT